ncbi:MAG: DUF2207 domain-containing protein [Acidobacteriota bacterium]|jgi:hypothetical protein|nr:MAG: hypothetical protein DIU54_06360 [Acidobacteriota bacterium]
MTPLSLRAAALLLAAVLATACTTEPATIGRIEQFELHASLQPTGDLAVTETLRITPDDTGRIALDRRIESAFADGVSLGSATIDGVAAGAELQVDEVSDGGLRVRWQPAGTRSGPASMVLEYTVLRAAAVNQPRGRLEWSPLLPGRAPAVNAVRLRLDLPETSRFYDGTGVGQPGWAVAIDGTRLEAERAPVGAGEGATLLAVFDVDRSQVRQGDWEWNLDRREQYFYALVAAGLFIVTIGIGILIVLRVQYPPLTQVDTDRREALTADRLMVARGLRTTAFVSIPFAGLLALAGARWLTGLGPAIYSIPASIVVVAIMLLVASWTYGRR